MFGPLSELTSRLDWLRDEMEPSFYPPLNAWEEGDAIKVEAEIPGVRIEEVEVSFDNGELTLKGEKKFDGNESATLHRRERLYGSFSRTLRLPWEVMAEKISAELAQGVLKLRIPKAEHAQPRRIEVRVT